MDEQGGRRDDVESTFVKGRWSHLGEATLMNRIKSRTDVGARWYPDLLRQLTRAQQQQSLGKPDEYRTTGQGEVSAARGV